MLTQTLDRLTEDPNITVLVLEYGPFDDQGDGVLVPGLWAPFPYFWPALLSTPQPGLLNQTFLAPVGAVVGGGSVVTGLFFHRGGISDFAGWESLGNPGWDWEGILPYYRKSENFTKVSLKFSRVLGKKCIVKRVSANSQLANRKYRR